MGIFCLISAICTGFTVHSAVETGVVLHRKNPYCNDHAMEICTVERHGFCHEDTAVTNDCEMSFVSIYTTAWKLHRPSVKITPQVHTMPCDGCDGCDGTLTSLKTIKYLL